MNIKEATQTVIKIVKIELKDKNINVTENNFYWGFIVDSMKLIEVCVNLRIMLKKMASNLIDFQKQCQKQWVCFVMLVSLQKNFKDNQRVKFDYNNWCK